MSPDKRPKSQSQRIRHMLYRLWEYQYKDELPFDEFYELETDKIISDILKRLPPREERHDATPQ